MVASVNNSRIEDSNSQMVSNISYVKKEHGLMVNPIGNSSFVHMLKGGSNIGICNE